MRARVPMTIVDELRRRAVAAVRDVLMVGLALSWLGALGACKPATVARVPRGGDLETYLAALESNESDLSAVGVDLSFPRAGAADVERQAEPVPESSPDRDADTEAEVDASPMDEGFVAEPSAAPPAAPIVESRTRRSTTQKKERRGDGDRCTRVCDLAEMACELEVRICELGQGHDEPRYETACARAQHQCAAAAEACRTC
jgi:hypothetical protein